MQDFELHASPLRPYRIVASVYALTERAPLYKVFSVHLAVASAFVDPQFITYQAGRCGILSWKRGIWEDRIVAAAWSRAVWRILDNCCLAWSAGFFSSFFKAK